MDRSPERPATGQKGGTPVYLYNRQLTLRPDSLRAGSAALVDAVTHLNANSSNQFALWQGLLGAPVGTFGASCRVESYSDFTDEVGRIYAEDEAYVDKVETLGTHLVDSPEDSLWSVAHVAGEMGDVPNVISAVRWQTEAKDFPAGIAFATEMADFFNSLHGATVSVSTSIWGVPFGIGLLTAYDSVAHFEESTAASQADPSFRDRLTRAVAIPASNQHGVMRRIL